MVDCAGKHMDNPTHAQTVNTRPSLSKRAAWSRGYRYILHTIHSSYIVQECIDNALMLNHIQASGFSLVPYMWLLYTHALYSIHLCYYTLNWGVLN